MNTSSKFLRFFHPARCLHKWDGNLKASPLSPAYRHSVSDRSSLYAPAGSIVAVEGLAEQRAHELVRRLKLHAVQSQFVYSHRYQPGDLLMWDNSATLHRAGPVGVPGKDDERRLLYRIVPTGIPKPLRTQVAAVTT